MIFDILFFIVGLVMNSYAYVMKSITNWIFPTWYESLIETWIEAIYQLNMFLPMVKDSGSGTGLYASIGILDLISWFFGAILLIKFIELVLWLAQFLPIFSPPQKLPHAGEDNTVDLGTSSNRLNLRSGRRKNKIRRNTRDIK